MDFQRARWPKLFFALCAGKHSLASWHGHLTSLHTNVDNPGLNRRRCNLNLMNCRKGPDHSGWRDEGEAEYRFAALLGKTACKRVFQ